MKTSKISFENWIVSKIRRSKFNSFENPLKIYYLSIFRFEIWSKARSKLRFCQKFESKNRWKRNCVYELSFCRKFAQFWFCVENYIKLSFCPEYAQNWSVWIFIEILKIEFELRIRLNLLLNHSARFENYPQVSKSATMLFTEKVQKLNYPFKFINFYWIKILCHF